MPTTSDAPVVATPALKLPTAYTILFALIAAVAAATWVVPAGQYERKRNEQLDRDVPVPGTYKRVDPSMAAPGAAELFTLTYPSNIQWAPRRARSGRLEVAR